jgi:hypothetical protein
MKGLAYVFLRKDGAPLPPGCAGHVAWGLLLEDGSSCYGGSTENYAGSPLVLPGRDNGWWGERFADEAALVAAMRSRSYDGYKVATLREWHPAEATAAALVSRGRGYTALGNNCLDHVWGVLSAYGVKDLPWLQSHPSPSDWFAVYNGEYHNL